MREMHWGDERAGIPPPPHTPLHSWFTVHRGEGGLKCNGGRGEEEEGDEMPAGECALEMGLQCRGLRIRSKSIRLLTGVMVKMEGYQWRQYIETEQHLVYYQQEV